MPTEKTDQFIAIAEAALRVYRLPPDYRFVADSEMTHSVLIDGKVVKNGPWSELGVGALRKQCFVEKTGDNHFKVVEAYAYFDDNGLYDFDILDLGMNLGIGCRGTNMEEAAELRLRSLGLDILDDGEVLAWSRAKNAAGALDPDATLDGWNDMGSVLRKDFYVRDPSGQTLGLHRIAQYGAYSSELAPEILIMDPDFNELEVAKPSPKPSAPCA